MVLTYECWGLAGVHVNVLGLLLGNHEAEQLLHTEGGLVAAPRQQRGLHRGSRARCNNRGNCLTIDIVIIKVFVQSDIAHICEDRCWSLLTLTQEDEEEGGGHDCVHDVCRLQLGTGGRDWGVELSTEVREVFTVPGKGPY